MRYLFSLSAALTVFTCLPAEADWRAANIAAAMPGHNDCIAIVGTGNVGATLGKRFVELGRPITFGSRDPESQRVRSLVASMGARASAANPAAAAKACPIIVFAVPWEAAETSLLGLGNLDGKIVVDVTNPLDVRDGREIPLAVPNSGAELIQAWAPRARIVKALNTVNYRVMATPGVAGGPVSVPLSGDDAAAKETIARLVTEIGLAPVDVGPLRTARYTENMALLYVSLLLRGSAYEFYMRPRPGS